MSNREAAKKLREKVERAKAPLSPEVEAQEVEKEVELRPLSEFKTKAELVAYGAEFGLELSDEPKMAEIYASIVEHIKEG